MRRAAPRHNLAQRGLRRRYARGRRAPSLLLLEKVSCVWREHAQVPWQLDGGSSTSTTACGEQSRAGCAKLRLLRRRWVPLLGCLAWPMAEQGRRRGGWRVEHHRRPKQRLPWKTPTDSRQVCVLPPHPPLKWGLPLRAAHPMSLTSTAPNGWRFSATTVE